MSWRAVVIANRAKLELKMDYLVVRDETSTKKIHLSEIYLLIIENTAVSLTASLISELSARKIKVVFCDEKRNPTAELVSYYGSHDTSLKIKQQIAWEQNIKDAIWTEIVTEKIRKQCEFLNVLSLSESEMLKNYIEEMEFKDASNREGHAAKVYFNALFGKDFSRSKDCFVNAALNYGYGIILSVFNREIVSSGYITQLGLFHGNMFNQFNFASDLMEPFRPLVDKTVYSMEKDLELSSKHKMQLVDVLNGEVHIDGKTQYVSNAIKIYCKSVFNALNEKDSSLLRFYTNEL